MGGSARIWDAVLDGDVAADSALELSVVMTKFAAPAVTIGYELPVEPVQAP